MNQHTEINDEGIPSFRKNVQSLVESFDSGHLLPSPPKSKVIDNFQKDGLDAVIVENIDDPVVEPINYNTNDLEKILEGFP